MRRPLALAVLATAPLSSCAAFAVPGSASPALRAPSAGSTRADISAVVCHGQARAAKATVVSFTFTCSNQDVTGFLVSSNVAIHSLEDPEEAFGCEVMNSHSGFCEDIHSGAASLGHATLTLAAPACSGSSRLSLRIRPYLNFTAAQHPTFTLAGPCRAGD